MQILSAAAGIVKLRAFEIYRGSIRKTALWELDNLGSQ